VKPVLPGAADYAAFDADVTTKDPGDAALLGIGVRVIIGGDSPGGVALGGVAWIGSFGTGNPAFVYPYRFYSSVKSTGEAASHEVGHTLGLLHDDNMPDGNAWGPIMVSRRRQASTRLRSQSLQCRLLTRSILTCTVEAAASHAMCKEGGVVAFVDTCFYNLLHLCLCMSCCCCCCCYCCCC
jgi:hypothetical protein